MFDGLFIDSIDYMYMFFVGISFILAILFLITSIIDINKCETNIENKNDSLEIRYSILISIITTFIIILLKSYY